MNITELSDLSLTRDAYMFFAQSLPDCETRARAKKILAIAVEEIRIKSLLKASGEKNVPV